MLDIYALTYDVRWYKSETNAGCNMILSKWPSYVYESEMSIDDSSRTLVLLEPINGINGVPFLLANLNLD